MSKMVTSFCFENGKMFKNLINSVKDIITDLQFSVSQNQIRILNLNSNEDVLIDIVIESSNLEDFELNRDKIIFCLDSGLLYKILNYCENKKPLTIYITEDDFHEGKVNFINIKIDGNVSKLKTIENQLEIECEKMDYDLILQVDTKVFLKNLKMIVDNAEFIVFDFHKKVFLMNNYNDSVEIENVIDNEIMEISDDFSYRSSFLSKNLKRLLKVNSFCDEMQISFIKNSPLFFQVEIFDLGILCFYFKSNDVNDDCVDVCE